MKWTLPYLFPFLIHVLNLTHNLLQDKVLSSVFGRAEDEVFERNRKRLVPFQRLKLSVLVEYADKCLIIYLYFLYLAVGRN